MNENENSESPAERYMVRIKITLVLFAMISVFFLAFAPYTPWIQRITYRHDVCRSNMQNMGIAVQSDALAKHDLRAYSVDENGKPLHSWRTLILPAIGHNSLYKEIRLNEPWDSEYNQQFHDVAIREYRCPSEIDTNSPQTNYRMLVGPGSVFDDSTRSPFSKLMAALSDRFKMPDSYCRNI